MQLFTFIPQYMFAQDTCIIITSPLINLVASVSATSCSGQNVTGVWQTETSCVHLSTPAAPWPWHAGASGCDGLWPDALQASAVSPDAVSTTQSFGLYHAAVAGFVVSAFVSLVVTKNEWLGSMSPKFGTE